MQGCVLPIKREQPRAFESWNNIYSFTSHKEWLAQLSICPPCLNEIPWWWFESPETSTLSSEWPPIKLHVQISSDTSFHLWTHGILINAAMHSGCSLMHLCLQLLQGCVYGSALEISWLREEVVMPPHPSSFFYVSFSHSSKPLLPISVNLLFGSSKVMKVVLAGDWKSHLINCKKEENHYSCCLLLNGFFPGSDKLCSHNLQSFSKILKSFVWWCYLTLGKLHPI